MRIPNLIIASLIILNVFPSLLYAESSELNIQANEPTISQMLEDVIPADFKDNYLVNVVDYFNTCTGATIEVDWAALEKWNVPKNSPVTLKLANMPAGRSLELALVSTAGDRLILLKDGHDKLYITMRREAEHLLADEPGRWKTWHSRWEPLDEAEAPTPREHAAVKMDKVIPWNFEQNRARNIFDYLRHITDSNFFVDWLALKQLGIEGDARITGTGEFKPATEVLDFVLTSLNDDLAWGIDDFGIVIISTREGLEKLLPAKNVEDPNGGNGLAKPPAEPGAEG